MPRKQMGRGSAREAAPLAELAKSPKIVEGEKTVSLIAEPSMSEPASLSPEPASPSQEPPSPSQEPQSLSPEPQSSQCCPALAEGTEVSEPGGQAEGQVEARDSQSPALPAKKFLNYELLFEIQKDSISTTYAARNIDLEGFLALRIFNERISDSGQIKEIQKAAGQARDFTHANHVTVYENGISDEGTPYVVSDWLKGESLADLIKRRKRLDVAYFLSVFVQICDVLADAHSRNLMHGNLNPEKIVFAGEELDDEALKVYDFGMPVDAVQNAFYMSPEQCLDRSQVDARSDIYSLGCIMYEALVGRPPQAGNLAVDVLYEMAGQYSPESPEHCALKLLDCVVKRCLHKKPAKRFGSVNELKRALNIIIECFDAAKIEKVKRLPRKAEKLLLFRFLDRFDRKITAALTAYLLLGLFAVKYIGEIQLQKLIDEAQIARFVDWPLAQSNYKEAIKQAELIGKPPGLLADLHWELADSYRVQALDSGMGVKRDKLAEDAIHEYEKAFEYFNHGPHMRSYALGLLDNMSQLYLHMPDKELRSADAQKTMAKLRDLMKAKKYQACASLAGETANRFNDANLDDAMLKELAAEANLKLGLSLPPAKAKSYLARSLWYYALGASDDSEDNPALKPLNEKLARLHLLWPNAKTYLRLGCDELLAGDLEAAAGYLKFVPVTESTSQTPVSQLSYLVDSALTLRRESSVVMGDPNKKKAIPLLERQLAILEQANGKHGPKLQGILAQLAACYVSVGDDASAMKTYKRYFEIVDKDGDYWSDQVVTVAYCDLLTRNHRAKEVPAFLRSRQLTPETSSKVPSSPLYILMIEAMARENMKETAAEHLRVWFKAPEYPVWDAEIVAQQHSQQPYTFEGHYYVLPPISAPPAQKPEVEDAFGNYPVMTEVSGSKKLLQACAEPTGLKSKAPTSFSGF